YQCVMSSLYSHCSVSVLPRRPPRISTLFPYTTLFRSHLAFDAGEGEDRKVHHADDQRPKQARADHFPRCRQNGLKSLLSVEDPEIGKHTSELQSHLNLVCRLLLEKKNNKNKINDTYHT